MRFLPTYPVLLNCFVYLPTLLLFRALAKTRAFCFRSDQKCPLRQLDLKIDVTVVQTLRLIILDLFLPGNRSRLIGTCILMQ